MDAMKIATEWLDNMAYTIATRDLEAHMQLVSAKVRVLGIADKRIDFHGWHKRRRIEFEKHLLQRIRYSQPEILATKANRVTFNVTENIKATDGQIIELQKEVVLKKEKDGQWRVRQERIGRIKSN